MRFYTKEHLYYCGIDLHARTMYVCIIDQKGEVLLHRDMRCQPEGFLRAIAPYRNDIVIAVECIFTWYWLADLCAHENIPFVLGHALYMKAIHGGKAKNDRIDSDKIARLLKGGMLPQAYVYPQGMRSTRDLMRRRLHLVRNRGELLAHILNTHHQYNLPVPAKRLAYAANRDGVTEIFEDPSVAKNVEIDLTMIAHYDDLIRDLELFITRTAKVDDSDTLHLLRSIPGVGKILSLTLLYEIHDIKRFPRVQEFASYARLIKCTKQSAGKILGTGGRKMGNVHLKWAFSEAATLFLRCNPKGTTVLDKIKRKHGKGKALSILAHKMGRTVYFMLTRRKTFDFAKFMNAA